MQTIVISVVIVGILFSKVGDGAGIESMGGIHVPYRAFDNAAASTRATIPRPMTTSPSLIHPGGILDGAILSICVFSLYLGFMAIGLVDGPHAAAAQQAHGLVASLQHGVRPEQSHQLSVAKGADFAGVAIVSTAVGTHL